jgi:transposase
MTIDQLTEQLHQREAQIKERNTQIEQREAQIEQRDATIAELTETVGQLQDQLAWCRRQLFGRKSERYQDPAQAKLFDESDREDEPEAAPTITVPSHERRDPKSNGRGKRQPIPDHLRREQIVHDLPEDERVDPQTGRPRLVRIGEEVSEKLAFKPGEVYVERHVRVKYRRVQENLGGDEPEVVVAPPSGEGLAKCLAAPSLLAEIAVRKYGDHQPLDRLVKIFGRHDVELNKASMCRWMQGLGELFAPLLDLMKRRMLEHSRIIQHDDTPVRQQAPGTGRCTTCRFWTALGQPGLLPGASGYYVIFDYTQNRQRAGPEQWFRDDRGQEVFIAGELQCDAFAGYRGLFDPDGPWRMMHIGCWAHVRRKFHDARAAAPGPACHALGLIRQLYDIEAGLKDADDARRLHVRQAEAAPRVDAFFAWCTEQQRQTLPRSAIGEALTYALNQQASLRHYLQAGHRPIDNNACERSLRGIAIGRKNWLFTGSPAGGRAAARLFSIIGSAQLHGLDPLAYLHHLIRRLPATPDNQLEQHLPENWSAAQTKN